MTIVRRVMADVGDAALPADPEDVRRLWLAYLTWGNDGCRASPFVGEGGPFSTAHGGAMMRA